MDRAALRGQRGSLGLLPALAVGCFFIYLCWNGYWLFRQVLPPSLLLGVFGIPAPSTGMTRAVRALGRGEVWLSLCWNPLAVPLLALYGGSLGYLAWRWLGRRRLVLPRWLAWAWCLCLAGAWIAKLCAGPAWW